MDEKTVEFDAESVARAWDLAADAYAGGQAEGLDYYRYEFFGPAQVTTCGEVGGLDLVDIGCGAGYFSREMASRGARVTGVDISARMIEHARSSEASEPLGITYRVGDAAHLDALFAPSSFDMATSCVAMQDMPDAGRVFGAVYNVLKPGGRLVTSVTHPCTDTPHRRWKRDAEGRKRFFCVDRYFDRGPIEYTWRDWPYPFATPSMHATLEDWLGWILEAGFRVRGLQEPCPTQESVRQRPELEDATRMPYFLFFDLEK